MTAARFHAARPIVCLRAALAAVALAFSLSGCANPNGIGVQDFGYIVGNVTDSSGKPIVNAIVQVTGTNSGSGYTGASGGFTIQNVAVGEQTLTATAVGYATSAPVTVIVTKDTGVTAPTIVLQSVLPQT
jgi:hypothetical protein